MCPMMTCLWNWRKIASIPGAVCAAASARIRPFTQVQKVIEVNINGAAQRFEPGMDVAALLERLQLAGKRVAVERNGEIVPRSRFAQTALANGDQLEIVVAVGGG
jgi:sulfur carrier protein